jgi:HAD superfamily hydrolase (TIGR01509 family)
VAAQVIGQEGVVTTPARAAILDIDGTLVDTNYHHAVAWFRAFRQHGHVVQLWRIHRHIGMGGDKLVASLLSEDVEQREGDAIRAAEKALYFTFMAEVEPLRGARELLEDLHDRGRKVVLASSAKAEEVDHYLDLLDARSLTDGWTTAADVKQTKPAPDLVLAALERLGEDADGAIMIGDSTWDCRAAEAAGIESIAVLTGGFSEKELSDAGAAAVFGSIDDLRMRLDETPLG